MGRSLHHATPKSTTMAAGPIAIASPIPAHLHTPPVPTRSSARRRQPESVTSSGPSSPNTPAPVTPSSSTAAAPSPPVAGPSRTPNPLSKSYVAPKNHQTRNHGDKDRETCPFPDMYGGKGKCGVSDEDERDDVLMACCAAIAKADNVAMTPEDIARIVFEEHSWLRAPSAAIERSTPINNAIRTHTKRCEKEGRTNLFGRVQLHGAAHESALASALLPGAFEGPIRPKGYVYFLAAIGPKKWKNPFEGIDLSVITAKKPNQPKKKSTKPATSKKGSTPQPVKAEPTVPAPVPKITLRLSNAQGQAQKPEADGDDEGEAGSHPPRPRAPSRTFSSSSRATITMPGLIRKVSTKPLRRRESFLSSGASGSSDSEPEMVAPSRLKQRKLPGLSLNTTSPFAPFPPNSPRHHAPYLPSPGLIHSPVFGTPQFSPCPSHSLDNTTWTVRRDRDLTAQFESSSSSSDDEMRESEWGMASGITIADGANDEMVWSAAEDETQIKEATDALRVLFPMGSPEEEHHSDGLDDSFDYLPGVSESGSLSESISTTTAIPFLRSKKGMKARECAAIPLAAWAGNSSPIGSPDMRQATLPIDVSPTQHLSRLRDSFEPTEMDVDSPVWIDESGEGPVRSPDDSFEDHLSSAGETTLEQEKHNDLFAWACEAAASRSQMQVKQEPEDYPSPLNTDDGSGYNNGSRASSAAFETHSSSSSEPDLPELDSENLSQLEMQEMLMGPESITIDEIEGWLPVNKEKTPRRKGRRGETGLSVGSMDTSFSSIGVGSRQAMLALSSGPKLSRKKSGRSRRLPLSSPTHATRLHGPAVEDQLDASLPNRLDFDMIGTEELENARAEAEAKEETYRKLAQQKAERHRACIAACRATRPGTASCDTPSTPWLDHPSPFDFSSAWGYGSTDSLHVNTPAASMLSPVMLQSVAGLSIGDNSNGAEFGVNPKHLVSPTFHPKLFGPNLPPFLTPSDHAMFNLEELVSQAEAAAGLLPPPLSNTETQGTAPIPIPQVNPTTAVPEVPKVVVDTQSAGQPAETVARSPTTPVPADNSAPSTASTSPAPTAKIGSAIGGPQTKSTLANTVYVPGDEGPYHGFVAILKNVIDGVLATVVDNIPVYVHVAGPFKGIGKVDVFRRLDSDFVNATTLLIALGVPMNQHEKHIYPDETPRGQTVIGADQSPGVSGIWVCLAQAQTIAQTLTGVNVADNGDSIIGNILRDDLFALFASMANLNPKHAPGLQFGISTFVPLATQALDKAQAAEKAEKEKANLKVPNKDPPKSTSLAVPSPAPGLAASSANSKSTPNLSALSTSAPATGLPARRLVPKGPLVRPAPAAPLETAPQPKRRRATIVEGITPKPSPLSLIKKTGSQSPTSVSPITPTATAGPAQNVRKVLPKAPAQTTSPAPAPPPAPAPVQKRATRASLGTTGMTRAKVSTK